MRGAERMEGFLALKDANSAIAKQRYGPNTCGCGTFAPTTHGMPLFDGAMQPNTLDMFETMSEEQRRSFWDPDKQLATVSRVQYRTDRIHYYAELPRAGAEPGEVCPTQYVKGLDGVPPWSGTPVCGVHLAQAPVPVCWHPHDGSEGSSQSRGG